MKTWKSIGCGVFVLTLLFGCSARDVTENDLKASKQMDIARGKCYESVSAQANADALMIKSVPTADRTMLTLVYLNSKQTTSLVAAATGHVLDKCAGTNLWDFMIAETEAKNRALSKGLGHAITGVKWIAGAWAATDIISNVGASNHVEGANNGLYVTNESKSRNTETSSKESYNTSGDSADDGAVIGDTANPSNSTETY